MFSHHNPFFQPAQLWEIEIHLDEAGIPSVDQAFDDVALSIANWEIDGEAKRWRTTIYVQQLLSDSEIEARLAVVESLSQPAASLVAVRPSVQKDWVKETQQAFPAFSVGGFHIRGSHVAEAPPLGATSLLIDANAAFGTGEHATTQACLLAMEYVCRRKVPRHALDMGCGSAILAMALAKRWKTPTLGIEIDAVSVNVARENVRLNQLQDRIGIELGNGYYSPAVGRQTPYDLIVANILARPLVAMAPQLACHLVPGGYAILSGLLTRQENMVLAAHRQQGLSLVRRWHLNGWSALLLKK